MDYFTKKRLAFWGIILLVIMNISSLTTVWMQQHRQPGPPLPPHRSLHQPPANDRFLQKKLGLTNAQTKELAKLQKQHFKQFRKIRRVIRGLKHELIDELATEMVDSVKAETLAREIGDQQSELETLTFYHFLQIKNLCTPDQQTRLGVLFGRLMRRFEQPPRPMNRRRGRIPGKLRLDRPGVNL